MAAKIAGNDETSTQPSLQGHAGASGIWRRAWRPLLMSVGAAALLSACMTGQDLELQGDSRDIALVVDATSAPATDLTDAISRVSPSFVTLLVKKPRKSSDLGGAKGVATGSGFFIDAAGHVLTAGHVAVARGLKVSARAADGRIHDGKVVAVSTVPDIGLIRLSGLRAPALTPAASPCLKKGEPVFSLGRPRHGKETARVGELVSMHFSSPVRYGRFGYDDAMVLRMNTRRGESGGPLLNARGELVGMIVSTLSRGGRSLFLAHAIPLTDLARFYCAKASCSARWKKLAGMSTRSCAATPGMALRKDQ